MEIEHRRSDQVGKRAWSILKAVFIMIRKGLLKGKLVVDLNVILKRSKLAGKAFHHLMLNHYSTITCRSDDARHLSFVCPREYEFSCSNSPADHAYLKHNLGRRSSALLRKPDVATLAAVQRVLEMLNNEAITTAEASPLPGFGKSPVVRQLRITDSPFLLKDEDGDSQQVDVAAEEFIKNFYKDLKSQRVNTAALESPYYYRMWS